MTQTLSELGRRTASEPRDQSAWASCKQCQTCFWFEDRIYFDVTLVVRKDLGMVNIGDPLNNAPWLTHTASPFAQSGRDTGPEDRWSVRNIHRSCDISHECLQHDIKIPTRRFERKMSVDLGLIGLLGFGIEHFSNAEHYQDNRTRGAASHQTWSQWCWCSCGTECK